MVKFLLVLTLLSGCAHHSQNKVHRKLSSEQSSEWQNRWKKYFSLHLLSEEKLDSFDRLLTKKNNSYLFSKEYASLQIIRAEIEEIEHEAEEQSVSLLTQIDNKSDYESLNQYLEMLKTLDDQSSFFKNSELFEQYSQKIKASILKNYDIDKTMIREFKGTYADYHVFEKTRFDLFQIFNNFQQKSNSQPLSNLKMFKLSKKEKKLKKEMRQLKAEIDQQAEELISEFKKQTDDRSPNSNEVFYPTTSKAGNIIGSEFPEKVWSLTFDDGPGGESSRKILETLKKNKMKATFFQLTEKVKSNLKMAKMIKDSGMEMSNHSYHHKQLTKVNAQDLEREITTAVKDMESSLEVKINLYRLPYGAGVSSPSIREKIAKNKLIHIFWTVDTLDWKAGSTPNEILNRTIKQMKVSKKDSGIILFHDIHDRTANTLPLLVEYLKQDQRRICTVGDVVEQMNKNDAVVCPSTP